MAAHHGDARRVDPEPVGEHGDDGSQGTLTIDTQTAKVTLKHQENYTETRDSTREFDL